MTSLKSSIKKILITGKDLRCFSSNFDWSQTDWILSISVNVSLIMRLFTLPNRINKWFNFKDDVLALNFVYYQDSKLHLHQNLQTFWGEEKINSSLLFIKRIKFDWSNVTTFLISKRWMHPNGYITANWLPHDTN